MAQRPAAVSSSAARQPDFIHLNDLASDAAGGKVRTRPGSVGGVSVQG